MRKGRGFRVVYACNFAGRVNMRDLPIPGDEPTPESLFRRCYLIISIRFENKLKAGAISPTRWKACLIIPRNPTLILFSWVLFLFFTFFSFSFIRAILCVRTQYYWVKLTNVFFRNIIGYQDKDICCFCFCFFGLGSLTESETWGLFLFIDLFLPPSIWQEGKKKKWKHFFFGIDFLQLRNPYRFLFPRFCKKHVYFVYLITGEPLDRFGWNLNEKSNIRWRWFTNFWNFLQPLVAKWRVFENFNNYYVYPEVRRERLDRFEWSFGIKKSSVWCRWSKNLLKIHYR